MTEEIRAARRPARARGTASAYTAEPLASTPTGFAVTVADRGRLVLPAEVRERLRIKEGDTLTLVLEPNGVIRLLTGAVYARSLRGMFKRLATPGRSMVDDLIADRRREAAAEEREWRTATARSRTKKRR